MNSGSPGEIPATAKACVQCRRPVFSLSRTNPWSPWIWNRSSWALSRRTSSWSRRFRARAKRWRLRSILPSSISKSRTEGHSRSRASFNETGRHSFSSRALGPRRFLPTCVARRSFRSRSTDVRSNGSASTIRQERLPTEVESRRHRDPAPQSRDRRAPNDFSGCPAADGFGRNRLASDDAIFGDGETYRQTFRFPVV